MYTLVCSKTIPCVETPDDNYDIKYIYITFEYLEDWNKIFNENALQEPGFIRPVYVINQEGPWIAAVYDRMNERMKLYSEIQDMTNLFMTLVEGNRYTSIQSKAIKLCNDITEQWHILHSALKYVENVDVRNQAILLLNKLQDQAYDILGI